VGCLKGQESWVVRERKLWRWKVKSHGSKVVLWL